MSFVSKRFDQFSSNLDLGSYCKHMLFILVGPHWTPFLFRVGGHGNADITLVDHAMARFCVCSERSVCDALYYFLWVCYNAGAGNYYRRGCRSTTFVRDFYDAP